MNDLTLTTERLINASPKKIFDAWLDPAMLQKFVLPGPGMTVPSASNDPKTGGRFSIIMKAGDNEIPHAGTYREITPYERLVFTWESPFSVDGSEVVLTFAPKDGGTLVTLTHTRFVDAEARDNHLGGWGNILTALDENVVT